MAIGCHKSRLNRITSGVLQGSTIGHMLFNLYINELPDLANDYESCEEETHRPNENLFNSNCRKYGSIPCYVDNALYTVSRKSRTWNQERLEIMLQTLNFFSLNANHLTVNKSKTTLQEMMLKQKRCKFKGSPPQLVTLMDKGHIKVIKAQHSNKILGGILQNDLQWNAHMESGEEPLLSALRKKLGTIKYLAKNAPTKTKLLLVNGLLLSKILYLLPLYGGTQQKYLNKIQVIMNNSIRFVTGLHKRSKTRTLMESVGWMEIK